MNVFDKVVAIIRMQCKEMTEKIKTEMTQFKYWFNYQNAKKKKKVHRIWFFLFKWKSVWNIRMDSI